MYLCIKKKYTTIELNNLFYVLDDLETKVEYNNYEELRPKPKPRPHITTAYSYPNNVRHKSIFLTHISTSTFPIFLIPV